MGENIKISINSIHYSTTNQASSLLLGIELFLHSKPLIRRPLIAAELVADFGERITVTVGATDEGGAAHLGGSAVPAVAVGIIAIGEGGVPHLLAILVPARTSFSVMAVHRC